MPDEMDTTSTASDMDTKTRTAMIRSIPSDVHHRCKIRCAVDKTSMQAVLLDFVTRYAAGE